VASLIDIQADAVKSISGAPGKSLVANVLGLGECTGDMELYSVPGIMGRPVPGTKGVEVSVGGIRVIVATHHYGISENIESGEVVLYGMDESGAIVCSITMKKDGHVIIKNDDENLKTLMSDLITEITAIKTIGSPPNHNVSPDSISKLEEIKVRFEALLG
jgi:hypothetical protein